MASKLTNEPVKIITNYLFGATTRSILMGAALCYSIKKENWTHIPLIIIFPSVYTGYHLYDNKEIVIKWIKEMRKS
jgi:hypothetical protein